jgi:cyanate lyase
MSDTAHGRKRRAAALRRLDETVVENALRQRDAAQIDAANARAESIELEAELTQWRTRAYELRGVMERMANDPTLTRTDVQGMLNLALARHNWEG